MKCIECGKEAFHCPVCGSAVPILKVVDIFHTGVCQTCKTSTDELCPERTRTPTVWGAIGEAISRIPWYETIVVTIVLTVLTALAWTWYECDGTVVRGLFWMECLG